MSFKRLLLLMAAVIFLTFIPQKLLQGSSLIEGINVGESNSELVEATLNLPENLKKEDKKGADGNTYQLFSLEGILFYLEEEGKPQLPVRSVNFQIPADAQDIKVEIIDSRYEEEEDVVVYPAPHRYFEENAEGVVVEQEKFVKDEELYKQDVWYPEKPVQITETAFIRQLRMVNLAVYPVLFNPQKKTIRHYTYLKIKVSYSSQESDNVTSIDTTNPYHKMFASTLANYRYQETEQLPQSPGAGQVHILTPSDITNSDPGFSLDYLVVSAELFYDNMSDPTLQKVPALNDLINWRKSSAGGNYDIGVVSVEDIYAQYPAGLKEESIKDFIQFAYDNWRKIQATPDLDFILLVGDADYGSDTEPWFMPTWRSGLDYYSTTGDNDYACLDGSDLKPDAMIGRLPVKNEDELGTVVSKTISFETNIPQGEDHWGTRNIFLGGYEFGVPGINGSRESLVSQYQEIQEWQSEDPSYGYTSQMVTDYINAEGALLLTYNAHGNSFSWSPHVYIPDLTNANQYMASVFSFACLTGHFDNNYLWDSLGEELLKHPNGGSAAFFGSSRIAWSSALNYDEILLPIIYENENYILGSALMQLKLLINDMYWHKHIKQYNLLGDPALNLSGHIAQSSKPELVSNLSLSNDNPSIGEIITIYAEIENRGLTAAEDVKVKVCRKEDGELVVIGGETIIPSLGSGEVEIIERHLVYDGQPMLRFVLQVDPENTIDELSDYNNHLNVTKSIQKPVYVDASNTTGIENGSEDYPFLTLYKGLNYVRDNKDPDKDAEVYVKAGDYLSSNLLEVPARTHVKGIGQRENIIIRDEFLVNDRYIVVENLTIDLNNSGSNKFFQGELIGCIIRNCTIGAKIAFTNLEHNIFYDNNIAIEFDPYNAGGGVAVSEIKTNTIVNNGQSMKFKNVAMQNSIIDIKNNIIWDNGAVIISGDASFYINYNNTNDNFFHTRGWGNINEDPLFVDEQSYDFHLNFFSPSIDAGSPYYDYENEPQPNGGIINQGAYGNTPEATISPVTIIYPENATYGGSELTMTYELGHDGRVSIYDNDYPDATYDNGNPIYTTKKEAGTYSYTFQNLTLGEHMLKVVLTNDDGVAEDQVFYFVLPDPPEVTITDPSNGSQVPENFTMAYTIGGSDPCGVGIFIDQLFVTEFTGVTPGQYTYDFENTPLGEHWFAVFVYNDFGYTEDTVLYTVVPSGPSVARSLSRPKE